MNLISREELREKLDAKDDFKLVMTLSEDAYRSKHIPRSVCVETVADALALLDRDDDVVVYCADVYCASSIYAYFALERAGYRRVRRYAGGVADWEGAGYRLEQGTRPERPAATRKRRLTAAQRPWRLCF